MEMRGKGKKRGRFRRKALEIGQWVSAGIVATGIVFECIYKADVCLVTITAGTFIWAVVQKVKHPNRNKEDK